MYSIEVTESAEKFLKKIPKNDSELILNKINSIKENPFRFLKRLKGYKLWRLRILKYRAIIDVVVSGNRIIVLKIGYRKNIYDEI
jgi:mRNA-degrading endonuclease RelE of RelBE toxin-antitoxin system